MIDKPIVENLGCMKGPQPLHFLSAGGDVYVAEEKNSGAELDPGPSGPLSLKMIHRIIFLALRAPRKPELRSVVVVSFCARCVSANGQT